MKRLLKKLLIGLGLVMLPIIGFSQHVIDDPSTPQYNTSVSGYNFKNLKTGVRVSMDSIHVSSAQILAGDSIPMLQGSKKAVITDVMVKYVTGYTPYNTSGSTDSTLVYSSIDGGSEAIVHITDSMYEGGTRGTSIPASTSSTLSTGCYYWLSIPSGKYSLGDGSYIVHYVYYILD